MRKWKYYYGKHEPIKDGCWNNWKRKAWRDLILAYAPEKEVLRVLDVGTGPGFFAMTLALEGHEVTAVDLTEQMLEHAAANAKAYGADVRFVLHRGENLPFEDGAFDCEYNDYDGLDDYEFIVKMFNKRDKSSITFGQQKKIRAIIVASIRPYLQNQLAEKINH